MAPPNQAKTSATLVKAVDYHRAGQFDRALKNYRRVLKQDTNQTDALMLGGQAAFQAGQQAEAIRWLTKACEKRPGDAEALYNLGVIYHSIGSIKDALQVFQKAVDANADLGPAQFNLGMDLNELGKARESLTHFDAAIRLQPDPNAALATKSIALNDHVLNHPTLIESPSSHTTLNGKQTGTINADAKGPITGLEMLIEKAVEEYMGNVADLTAHPVVAFRPQCHEVSIWATVLEGEGFQAPHIHPSGWLSGVYYPQVSGVVDEGGNDGWITFGKPGPEYHFTRQPPQRMVKPQPGMLVMFPSYMFHHTIPFQSDETRISITFDVMPR